MFSYLLPSNKVNVHFDKKQNFQMLSLLFVLNIFVYYSLLNTSPMQEVLS